MLVSFTSNTTGVTCGAGTAYSSGVPYVYPRDFCEFHIAQYYCLSFEYSTVFLQITTSVNKLNANSNPEPYAFGIFKAIVSRHKSGWNQKILILVLYSWVYCRRSNIHVYSICTLCLYTCSCHGEFVDDHSYRTRPRHVLETKSDVDYHHYIRVTDLLNSRLSTLFLHHKDGIQFISCDCMIWKKTSYTMYS